jgi:hypothetical protein
VSKLAFGRSRRSRSSEGGGGKPLSIAIRAMGVGAAELSGWKVASLVADPGGDCDSVLTVKREGDAPPPARF